MKLRDYLLILHAVLSTAKQEHFFYNYILNNQLSEDDLPLSQADFTDLLVKYDNYQFLNGSVIKAHADKVMNFIDHQEKYRKLKFLAICDTQYPKQLKEIYQAPIILFYEGDLAFLKSPMLTVVGTRLMTEYGQKILEKLIAEIVGSGVSIVSGLAKGIDVYSHELTLQNSGTAIAVIGNGINVNYPAANKETQDRIRKHGLLISEYFPDVRPKQYHFPARNRILAGLSSATLVIEAKQHSGSLITAAYATQENRNVLAIPGNVDQSYSDGTNQLIAAGAKLVLTARDILNEIICY
ncbi:DNA-processing protein DprA [Oenococcus sicerae]|uniref:DNA-protecting protein DprA n=1 Tax=Oenococcus sicerae TaxID=2203724 RepID=A0AAJ1VML0_9LACO|nr:DNA-processing protein DprA [Oenococcus sicerae]MDN6899766.1 DNA-protecting protein DprA [Oenococcus sicerae]